MSGEIDGLRLLYHCEGEKDKCQRSLIDCKNKIRGIEESNGKVSDYLIEIRMTLQGTFDEWKDWVNWIKERNLYE